MTLVGMGIFLGGLIFGWAFVTRIGNVPLSLTVSGGVLIAGLICGWRGPSVRRWEACPNRPSGS